MNQLKQNLSREKICLKEIEKAKQKFGITSVTERKDAHLKRGVTDEAQHFENSVTSKYQEDIPLCNGVEYDLIKGVEYDLVPGVEYDIPLVETTANKEELKKQASLNEKTLKHEQVEKNSLQDMFCNTNFSLQATGSNLNEDSNIDCSQRVITALPEQNTNVPKEIILERDLLNFRLKLIRKIIEITDTENGESQSCYYVVKTQVITRTGNLKIFEAIVDSGKIKDVDWVIRTTHSLATIPREKNEKIEFFDKVQSCIETENVPVEIIYPNAGWRNILGIGFRYVYGDGVIGEENSLIHSVSGKYKLNLNKELLGTMEVFQEALGMMQICRNGRTSESLFLFTHASVLTTLFEQAGFPICFVYGIAGVTNSRKTSLALAMAKIFDRKNAMIADAEFATATACGIEKVLNTYKDAVVIIDDFKPGVNQGQQRMMDQKLDQLVRFYGNRVSKKRMLDFNSDSEKKYYPINGACVLTLEVVTGVLSSISRMYLTEITNNDVDNEKLLHYQSNLWILPTNIYDFIDWITNNFEYAVGCISSLCVELRGRCSLNLHRYAQTYAIMMTTAIIFSEYAIARGFWNDGHQTEFLTYIERSLITEFQIMQGTMTKRDKAYVVMQALKDYLNRNYPAYLSEESCILKYDYYQDEKIIYIRSKMLYKIVNEYCRLYGEPCQIINEDELFGLLERIQVLDISDNGKGRERGRKLPIQRGNHFRYLYIIKDMITKDFD